jgi:transcriptional regulator with XRE-family HTH domain
MKKTKTYMEKLMNNREFRKRFDEEYQNICIGEQIARIRHRVNLTQDALAKRTHTTKSAISRYENSDYKSYSISLLNRIAEACGTVLKIDFVTKGTKKVEELK